MSEQAPKQYNIQDWHPVYGWKSMSAGMDSGVIDIGVERTVTLSRNDTELIATALLYYD